MAITVIEQLVKGKRGAEYCEDGIIVTPDFVAVIDGSTSKSLLPELPDGRSRGQVAMLSVKQTVSRVAPDITLADFCQAATADLRQQYAELYPHDMMPHMAAHAEDRFCCSAVVYSLWHNEIWLIGDCHCLLVNQNGSTTGATSHSIGTATCPSAAGTCPSARTTYHSNDKPYEQMMAQRRADYLRKALDEGRYTTADLRRHDYGRDLLLPDFPTVMRGENTEYAVIDGFPIYMEGVKTVSVNPGDEIVLASDGYPRLFPTLQETEQFLCDYKQRDPLFIRDIVCTKGWMEGNDSFDDRSYIRFNVLE